MHIVREGTNGHARGVKNIVDLKVRCASLEKCHTPVSGLPPLSWRQKKENNGRMTCRRWNAEQYSTQLNVQGQKWHLKVVGKLAAVHGNYSLKLLAEDWNQRRRRRYLWSKGRCQEGS